MAMGDRDGQPGGGRVGRRTAEEEQRRGEIGGGQRDEVFGARLRCA